MAEPMKTFLLRIPQDTYDRLKALADDGDRPVSAEVRRAIRAHIEACRATHS